MQGRQVTCFKHSRPYQLLGNDDNCDMNCQICCDCLRGLDNVHKKDNVNHQTISVEQISYHFEKIYKFNQQSIMECNDALDKYFHTFENLLKEEIHQHRQRLSRLVKKIMLTDITKDQPKLQIIVALFQKQYGNIKCKQIGEVSKNLFSFVPKEASIGFKKFREYISSKQNELSHDIRQMVESKACQKSLLKHCEQDILFPEFQNLKTQEKQKETSKNTLSRSVRKQPKQAKSDRSLKNLNIQIKKPVQFVGSKLIGGQQETLFLNKLFSQKRIQGVRLLFRASENNFSVKQFHQHCDNEADTFVIVQTEFNKVIGGFTPIPWRSTTNTLHSDIKCQSFLFSLTLKQKMSIIDEKSAVFNSVNFGPTFGAGADLAICHNGHIQKTSYSQFPYSYANSRYKQSSQHSTTLFTGQKNGNHFLLKQWEVWKIVFE